MLLLEVQAAAAIACTHDSTHKPTNIHWSNEISFATQRNLRIYAHTQAWTSPLRLGSMLMPWADFDVVRLTTIGLISYSHWLAENSMPVMPDMQHNKNIDFEKVLSQQPSAQEVQNSNLCFRTRASGLLRVINFRES